MTQSRAWLAALWLAAQPAAAETLRAQVVDADGSPVADAVVHAQSEDSPAAAASPAPPVAIDQVDKEFVPHVTALRAGTSVRFPNRDQIRHHVYSFSEAKTFEIPLYEGTPAEPIVFDRPGEVVLGCNIHDWMKAYVFVADSPWFAVTDASGSARLELPAGVYSVRVWHPALRGGSDATARRHVAGPDGESALRFEIERGRVWRPRRSPSLGDPVYR